MSQPQRLLTEREVCALLSCCRKTVQRMRQRGELKAVQIGSRNLRYREGDVARWQDRLKAAK